MTRLSAPYALTVRGISPTDNISLQPEKRGRGKLERDKLYVGEKRCKRRGEERRGGKGAAGQVGTLPCDSDDR
jgi:hypothetical protein